MRYPRITVVDGGWLDPGGNGGRCRCGGGDKLIARCENSSRFALVLLSFVDDHGNFT